MADEIHVTNGPGLDRPAFTIQPNGRTAVGATASWVIVLHRPSRVRAELFDVHGRLVDRIADGPMTAGDHVLRWDGSLQRGTSVGSGVYWLRVQAGKASETRKVVVAR